MAALGQARSHTMRDIVASIQAEQDLVIRAPAASVTYVEGGPGTGKTAVALHRAAYLLYQDRRRYAGGILIVSPTPAARGVHRGRPALPGRGGPGRHPRHRLPRRRRRGHPVRLPGGRPGQGVVPDAAGAAQGRARGPGERRRRRPAAPAGRPSRPSTSPTRPTRRTGSAGTPTRLRVVAFGRRLELEAGDLDRIRQSALSGTAPVNLLRPRARKLLLDALWERSGAVGRHTRPRTRRRTALLLRRGRDAPRTRSSPSSTPGGPS